jgi:HD-like signal output (HDOD) protein
MYTFFVVDYDSETMERYREIFSRWPHLVYYCSTIQEAKSIMEGVTADFLITRLRMPGVSPADFLTHVREKCPHSIRLVYSESRDRQELINIVASGIAHRYMCLPWEKDNFTEVLSRDLLTRSRLRQNKCWKFLAAGGEALPSLPEVVIKLEEVLRQPDYSLENIAGIIEKDPAISSKLLQVANSSAFARNSVIHDLKHAVSFLGVKQIKEIVLYLAALKSFKISHQCHANVAEISEHSFLCSRLAVEVANTVLPGQEREVATAALLHDIGKLVFFSSACGLYRDFISGRDTPEIPASEFETELFGVTHAELGSSLMLWWNLPMNIIETAANHNLPLIQLWGVPLCVAIADRCLIEAAGHGEKVVTDLDVLANEFPVDEWRTKAWEMLLYSGRD